MKRIDQTAILSSAYLPNIQYISKLLLHQKVVIDINETFGKQSYRNRCNILGANGVQALSIPIIKPNGNKSLTKEILIDYSMAWQQVHWKSILSAYKNSPFFEFLEEEFSTLYTKKEKYLIDYNYKALNKIGECLGIEFDFAYSDAFINEPDNAYNFRDSIHPKARLQRPDSHYEPSPYHQTFGDKFNFQPNLSFIDLMFNEGPQAIFTCKKSIVL